MLSWELFSLDLGSIQYWMRVPRVAPAETRKQKSDVASATISVMNMPLVWELLTLDELHPIITHGCQNSATCTT